jgi:hypothetical protein
VSEWLGSVTYISGLYSGGGWFGTLATLTEVVHGLPSPYKPRLLISTSLKFIINYHLIIRYGLPEF